MGEAPHLALSMAGHSKRLDVTPEIARASPRTLAVPEKSLDVRSEALDRLRALDKLGRESWPVTILLDIKMPKVSGVEVLREIKSDARLKSLPVVMLTSSRQGPDITRCYELGANAYVVKPVGFAEFFEAVKALGKFWAVVNEGPAASKAGEAGDELLATGRS